LIRNNFLKKTLDISNIIIIIIYSISLVIFVNNPSKTYIENYFGYLVLLIFIAQAIFIYKKVYFPKIYLGFMLFLILSFILLIISPSNDSYNLLVSLIQIFIFSIIIYNMLIYNDSSIPLEIGLVSGLTFSIYTGYFIGRDYFSGSVLQRYSGTLENPNHYSFMLTVALLFLIRRFLYLRHSKKYNKSINILIIGLILIFSYEVVFYAISRQGVLLVILLLSFLFFQIFRTSNIIEKLGLFISSIFIITYSWFVIQDMPLVYSRLGTLFTIFNTNSSFEMDTSLISRFAYMNDAYDLWLQKPLFGHGLHQFKHINQSGVSHNNFFEILVNNGIVGFVAYYAFYIYIVISYFKIKIYNKVDSNWILTVIFMLFIADMTILTYMEKPNWLIFSVVLFVINSNKINKNNFTINL